MSKAHDDIAEDLATAKGGIPFLNACLGSVWADGKTPRADLVVCRPTYKEFTLSIFEVKISRADFLSDIRSDKWRLYLPHCHRFYFAAKDGVCKKSDIPEEAGLMIRNNKGWYTAKAAPRLTPSVPQETLLSLVFARQRRSAREKRIDDILAMRRRGYDATDFMGGSKAARVHGKEVAKLLGVIGSTALVDVIDFLNRNRRFVWEDICRARSAKRESQGSEQCQTLNRAQNVVAPQRPSQGQAV